MVRLKIETFADEIMILWMHVNNIYEATKCSLYIGREKMAMYGSVVTPVWCNGDGHGNQRCA